MKIKVTGGIVVGAMLATGIAYAAIPGPDGTVSACYATSNGLVLGIPHTKGEVRLVSPGETCRSYEAPVTWSQKGPQGPPGPVHVYATGFGRPDSFPELAVTRIQALALPAGTFLINSKAVFVTEGAPAYAECSLDAPATELDESHVNTEIATSSPDSVPFDMVGTISSTTPFTVTVDCFWGSGGSPTSVDVFLTKIVATRVDAVN